MNHPYLFRTPAAREASSTRATLPPATGFSGAPPSPSPSSRLSRYGFLIQYYKVITFLISHLNVQIGIATKYFGPIILSISSMLQDVFLFLITFCVIMVAFGCGVSFIFNMASGQSVCWGDCTKITNEHS